MTVVHTLPCGCVISHRDTPGRVEVMHDGREVVVDTQDELGEFCATHKPKPARPKR